jgi:hypothetical protein
MGPAPEFLAPKIPQIQAILKNRTRNLRGPSRLPSILQLVAVLWNFSIPKVRNFGAGQTLYFMFELNCT